MMCLNNEKTIMYLIKNDIKIDINDLSEYLDHKLNCKKNMTNNNKRIMISFNNKLSYNEIINELINYLKDKINNKYKKICKKNIVKLCQCVTTSTINYIFDINTDDKVIMIEVE